ncbi:hypothetical protein HNQ91_001211 [Filimonas zeae]|uniref:hypothetical protein n=1 Tax=Filimonas zeae TaxID=1737353 RepID=UPI0016666082|nr:hypothetical protein [Filimonas zeae]MDR6338189.1 hypothetical protein [Filimonas zeae]
MKQAIYLFVLCIFYYNTQAQQIGLNPQNTFFYLDTAKVAYAYYMHPNDIDSISVTRGYDSTTKLDGKIRLFLKKPGKVHFIPLDSIATSKQLKPGTPILYIIDNDPIKSPERIRIDTSFIQHAWVIRATEIDNLKNMVPNLSILYIKTGKPDPNAPQRIIIRGQSATVSR